MPRLEGFVRIRYSTNGPARDAMRLLNEHIDKQGLREGEAHRRVLSFVNQGKDHGKSSGRDHADPRPRGPMHMPAVLVEAENGS